MSNEDQIYLAYSGEVPRDSPKAKLLKRAWESLRRDDEFRHDCGQVTKSKKEKGRDLLKKFEIKWGLLLTDPLCSFDEIVGDSETIELDRHDQFNDIYRRLYGDTFYGPDKLVQCHELDEFYHWAGKLFLSVGVENLQIISRASAALTNNSSDGERAKRHPPVPRKIHLILDVDANPIAVLFKVQWVVRVLREARATLELTEPITKRIRQQLITLEKKLDADLVGGGRRDFSQDDSTFKVWDLKVEGWTDTQIARTVWQREFRRKGGRDTTTGDKGAIIQRVHDYKRRANKWIREFAALIKNDHINL